MERILEEFISKANQGFEFSRGARPGADVFHCKGAFSIASHEEMDALELVVRESKEKRVVLDLRNVVHIDSSGIGTLATILKELRAAGRDLHIVPSKPVRLALGMVKIDTLMKLHETLDAALES